MYNWILVCLLDLEGQSSQYWQNVEFNYSDIFTENIKEIHIAEQNFGYIFGPGLILI